METKYLFISDPGHGWLRVPKSVIKSMGIADKITHYSYMSEKYVYLEEDCDCTMFFRALNVTMDEFKLMIRHTDTNNWASCRRYPNFDKTKM